MSYLSRQLSGQTDVAPDAGWTDAPARKGFFTDTSICIGCKACEVACKEWNALPLDGLDLSANSYDNTGGLGASTWRHVAFVEQTQERIAQARQLRRVGGVVGTGDHHRIQRRGFAAGRRGATDAG